MVNRNLDKLNTKCSDLNLSYCQLMSFKALFLGAISREVPPSVWDDALNRVASLFKEDECQATNTKEESSQASPQS